MSPLCTMSLYITFGYASLLIVLRNMNITVSPRKVGDNVINFAWLIPALYDGRRVSKLLCQISYAAIQGVAALSGCLWRKPNHSYVLAASRKLPPINTEVLKARHSLCKPSIWNVQRGELMEYHLDSNANMELDTGTAWALAFKWGD